MRLNRAFYDDGFMFASVRVTVNPAADRFIDIRAINQKQTPIKIYDE